MSINNDDSSFKLPDPVNEIFLTSAGYFNCSLDNNLNSNIDHEDSVHSSDSEEFNHEIDATPQQIYTKWNASIAIVPSAPDSQYIDDNYNRLTLVQVDDLFSFIRISNCKLLANEINRRAISVKHCQDRNGLTILHVVTELGDFDSVKYVCTIGADCKAVDRWGRTPLHLACHNGHVEVALYLIAAHRCDPLARSNQGYTCLHYAALHANMIQILLEIDKTSLKAVATNGCTPFLLSCKGGAFDSVRLFFEEDQVDILACDSNGVNGLCFAAWNGFLSIVEFLLTNIKIKSNINHQSNYGYTCLHYACLNGNINIIEVLLENGVDLEIRDENGMLAKDMNNDPHLVQYLENSRKLLETETGVVPNTGEVSTIDEDNDNEDVLLNKSNNVNEDGEEEIEVNDINYLEDKSDPNNSHTLNDIQQGEEKEEEQVEVVAQENEEEEQVEVVAQEDEEEEQVEVVAQEEEVAPSHSSTGSNDITLQSTTENLSNKIIFPLIHEAEDETRNSDKDSEFIVEPETSFYFPTIDKKPNYEEDKVDEVEGGNGDISLNQKQNDENDISNNNNNNSNNDNNNVNSDDNDNDTADTFTITSTSFSFTANPMRKTNKFDLEADDEDVATNNPFSLLGTASTSASTSSTSSLLLSKVLTPPPVRRVNPMRRLSPDNRTNTFTTNSTIKPVFSRPFDPVLSPSVSLEASLDTTVDSEVSELEADDDDITITTATSENDSNGVKYISTEDMFGTFDTRDSTTVSQIQVESMMSTNERIRRSVFDFAAVGDVNGLQNVLGRMPTTTIDINTLRHEETGQTPLHTACQLGNIHAVQFLVEGAGADVNAVDNQGNSSLHIACAEGHSLIVRYLVKFCGVDLTLKDHQGRLAITLVNQPAGISEKEDIVRIITKGFRKSASKRTKIKVPRMSK